MRDPMDIDQDCADYEAATSYFLEAARSVSDNRLDAHREGGWSARQVIHHMADSEAQSYARLRRLIAEAPGSSIQGYDEAAWADNATLGYTSLAVDTSLAVVAAVRAASLTILHRLTSEDLTRYGEHSESGRYEVATWIETYTEHPMAHAAQLLEAATSPLD